MKDKLISFVNWIKKQLDKLPTFADDAMEKACKICGGIIIASSLFYIFEMFTYDDFGIKANWNIFTSWLFGPLFVVGFITAIVKWGAMGHWGGQPYDIYEDENGNKKAMRNDDLVENMYWQFMMPLLGHFVFEPIIYASIIYYPLMCIVALLGVILPFALTVILIGICAVPFLFSKQLMKLPYRSIILVAATALLAIGLTWSSINMESKKHKSNTPVEQVEQTEEAPATTDER